MTAFRNRWASRLRLPALVACLVLAFLAVGWLGMKLAGDAEAETGRDSLAETPTTTLAPRATPPRSKTWAERASASCARGLEGTRALLDAAPSTVEPGATEHEFLLTLLDASLKVERRVVRELGALPVSRADQRRVREVIRLLDETHRMGVGLAASLRVRWDDALLERKLRENARAAARLRLLFLGLGATGCAAYVQA